jgi:hypothetical protein
MTSFTSLMTTLRAWTARKQAMSPWTAKKQPVQIRPHHFRRSRLRKTSYQLFSTIYVRLKHRKAATHRWEHSGLPGIKSSTVENSPNGHSEKNNQKLLTYLLTELSPSWEAANCAATQEFLSILWKPKFHYRVHNSPPLVPIMSQIDPGHTIASHLCKIYFNIVHLPTSWSS